MKGQKIVTAPLFSVPVSEIIMKHIKTPNYQQQQQSRNQRQNEFHPKHVRICLLLQCFYDALKSQCCTGVLTASVSCTLKLRVKLRKCLHILKKKFPELWVQVKLPSSKVSGTS